MLPRKKEKKKTVQMIKRVFPPTHDKGESSLEELNVLLADGFKVVNVVATNHMISSEECCDYLLEKEL